jgi:hypothetical protein
LRAVRDGQVFAMDASSHFSRPGPRIAEGIVELAELFSRVSRRRARKSVVRVRPMANPAKARQGI